MDFEVEIQKFQTLCVSTAVEMAEAKPAGENPKDYFYKTFLHYNGQLLPHSEKILEAYSGVAEKAQFSSLARILQDATEKGLEHYKDLLGVKLDFEMKTSE